MRRYWPHLVAGVLLALYWWMAWSVSDQQCTTGDEIAHLTAGYSYWKFDDYRLQPENGNLPQRWAAIPLLAKPLTFPRLDQNAWRISDVWDLGFQWFYLNGNDLPGMLRDGRRMIALFGVATGMLVFYWARRLHGDRAAVLAAFLFAFCPTMLANGALVTSDMCATCMFLAAVTSFWSLAHRLTVGRTLLFGLMLGLVCVAKFSAPLIAPMCALLWVVRLTGSDRLPTGRPFGAEIIGRGRIAGALVVATLVACGLALVVLWASYGFRYDMRNHYEPGRVRDLVGWDVLDDQHGPEVPVLHFLRDHHLLPESYIYGFAHTYRFSHYRKAFLNGEYRSTGWVQFFPYTTLVKTPLALFGLIGLALLGLLFLTPRGWDWRRRLYGWAPLLALFVVYWTFSLTSGLNIGHRHIMPTYPVMFVLAAGAAAWLAARRPLAWVGLAALAAWFAGESLWIRPHYLAYFNELVGPADAYHHLVDSSLDWGQDLPSVRRWLDAHPPQGPVYLSYFGSGDVVYYRIPGTRIGDVNFDLRPRRRTPQPFGGGLWIMSVTQFQQVYTEARGPWDRAKEVRYRQMLADLLKRKAPMTEAEGNTFEEYQFARFCHFLRTQKTPIAQPAYTFLVYEVTDAEARNALYGPLPVP